MRARGPATEDSGARVSFPVCWRGSDVQERSEAAQTFSLFVLFCSFRDLQIPNFNRSLGARRHPPENDPARKLDHSMLIDERAAAREQAEDYGGPSMIERATERDAKTAGLAVPSSTSKNTAAGPSTFTQPGAALGQRSVFAILFYHPQGAALAVSSRQERAHNKAATGDGAPRGTFETGPARGPVAEDPRGL